MGSARGCPGIPLGGFPHSGIPGSTPAGGSPRLIAASHALHRLLAPRHPPCALSSLLHARRQKLKLPAPVQLLRCPISAQRFTAGPHPRPRRRGSAVKPEAQRNPAHGRARSLPREASILAVSSRHGHPIACSRSDFKVGLPGLEPGTSPLSGERSNQLS